jgi:hypothetical protein
MSASELRELAADERFVAHRIMALSPHTTGEQIADVLEGAEYIERRAAFIDAETERRAP